VLWKLSSAEEPGWDSPWGRGRPGWHIECSAMSEAYLGKEFDIHGGGLDLIFPHHENEIAQSRCAHGTAKMANVWMHNGFLQVEGQKMSKSLGNFVTINEVLNWSQTDLDANDPNYSKAVEQLSQKHGATARLLMLRTHYRQPIDWSKTGFIDAQLKLATWRQAVAGFNLSDIPAVPDSVIEPLMDDLNTHLSLAALDELAKRAKSTKDPYDAAGRLAASLQFLGFESELSHLNANDTLREALAFSNHGIDRENVEVLVATRLAVRAAKNWKESDRIRDELAAMGVTIKDNKDGTTSWEVKR
jgi:cysteinyl-tRNA synthetase